MITPPRPEPPSSARSLSRRALLGLGFALGGCAAGSTRPTVPLRLVRDQRTPRDAGVWIDEEFVGPLNYVSALGVRVPAGEHRITVQKQGYFPWDRVIVADGKPLVLEVVLEPIPD